MVDARSARFRSATRAADADGPAAELAWVLARAFAEPGAAAAPIDSAAAVGLARALRLAPRIASRHAATALEAELGEGGALELRRLRALAVAEELRADEALATVEATGRDLGEPLVLLKGMALRLGGWVLPGARPAADIDLLVAGRALAAWTRALLEAGFTPSGERGREHHAPMLRSPHGVAVELHRAIPGVRLDGARSARLADLAARGELRPPSARRQARLPAAEVLAAHVLVHAIVQNAPAPSRSGLLWLADLLDLGYPWTFTAEATERVAAWTGRDLAREELEGVSRLIAWLRDGAEEIQAPGEPAAALLGRFVAASTDPLVAASLRLEGLRRPLSDAPAWIARLRILARAFLPPATGEGGGWSRRLGRALARPLRLLARWRRARRAARDLAAGDR